MQMRHLNKLSKPRALGTEKSRALTRDFQGTTMALPKGCLTTLDEPKYVETWIRCFEALARVKKLRDRRGKGEQNEITDMFLATAGSETIQKVSTMTYPRNLRADFQRNWWDNKKEDQIKEKVGYRRKTNISGNETSMSIISGNKHPDEYYSIHTPNERKS